MKDTTLFIGELTEDETFQFAVEALNTLPLDQAVQVVINVFDTKIKLEELAEWINQNLEDCYERERWRST